MHHRASWAECPAVVIEAQDLHELLPVRTDFRAKRVPTAGRQARAGETVPRTARPGPVARRWQAA